MTIHDYINRLNAHYKTGISSELTYRGDLQNLLEHQTTEVHVNNKPKRIECGAPD